MFGGDVFFSDPFWTINVQNISMCALQYMLSGLVQGSTPKKKEEIQDETETSLAVY